MMQTMALVFVACSLNPPALTTAYPDAPRGAVVVAAEHAIQLQSGDRLHWSHAFDERFRPQRVGLTPDLDGDNQREVRVRYALVDDKGDEPTFLTHILAGADGRLLYTFDETSGFDPWADLPADTNHDGEVTYEDDLGLLLPLAERLDVSSFDRWFSFRVAYRQKMGPPDIDSYRATRWGNRRDRDDTDEPGGGQPGPAVQLTLKEVKFSGAHTIYRDYSTVAPPFPPPVPPAYQPRWYDKNLDGDADDWASGDERGPIAYTAGTPVAIAQVTIEVSPPFAINTNAAQIVGRVDASDYFTCIGAANLTYNGTGTELTATLVSGSYPSVAGIINYWPNYTIDWRIDVITPFGGATYPAGTSDNPTYFVLENPTGGFPILYSYLDIGCRNAIGLDGSSHLAIAQAIFSEFQTQSVQRRTDILEGITPAMLTY